MFSVRTLTSWLTAERSTQPTAPEETMTLHYVTYDAFRALKGGFAWARTQVLVDTDAKVAALSHPVAWQWVAQYYGGENQDKTSGYFFNECLG